MIDWTMIIYMAAFSLVAYALLLFSVWLVLTIREGGRIGTVYLFLMGWFAARGWGLFLGVKARLLHEDHAAYYDFMNDNVFWDLRVLPEAIVVLCLTVAMSNRFIRSYLFNDPDYRRKNGRRKSDGGYKVG